MSDRRLAELRDLEAISELKARYFRLVDTKDWDRFRQLFVSDARFELLDANETIDGADAFVAFVRSALNASKSAHHGHTPEITLDSPTQAHGTWALADYVEWPSDEATGERRGFKGYGAYEETFNLPGVVAAAGASFVARWTAYHVKQLAKTMGEALNKKGFRFIEVIAPCPTLYLRRNRLGEGLEEMKYYQEKSVIKNGANPQEVGIDYRDEIIVGKFVDVERPTLEEAMEKRMTEALGPKYVPYKQPGKMSPRA